ncbi:hypothetical protein LQR30_22965 [Chromobacterium piscinae]|uniref:hypothetical protein n=1 Tax=Chromobacterium piscinae TaxID=686831 RepID=UPI001E3C943D|nr:hypothetical protein [Chromobacterium piscinae]MCD4506934.1 hypothetical protein [Chromobacterium piscinae]
MAMYKFISMKSSLSFFMIFFLSNSAFSAASPHLLFHIGLGVDARYEVRATIANRGDQSVARGYVVISAHDVQCQNYRDVLQSFGEISAGEKSTISILLDERIAGYRLTAFNTFDDMGFPLQTIDETATIIQGRELMDRQNCIGARKERLSDN